MVSEKINAWLNYWNNVVYQYRMGMFDEAEFDHQVSVIRNDMEIYPGLKAHWCANKRLATNGLLEAVEGNRQGTYCTVELGSE